MVFTTYKDYLVIRRMLLMQSNALETSVSKDQNLPSLSLHSLNFSGITNRQYWTLTLIKATVSSVKSCLFHNPPIPKYDQKYQKQSDMDLFLSYLKSSFVFNFLQRTRTRGWFISIYSQASWFETWITKNG